MNEVLRTEGLSVSYGGVKALEGVELAVHEGQLVGLIGPNGAGKTTFVDATTGFAPSVGRVLLRDEDISSLPAHQRARRGLARTWQGADLFDDLNVRENLTVACESRGWRVTLREILTSQSQDKERVDDALAKVGLEHVAERGADELTQGQRKLVGVARALVGDPRVICLDEPAAGLDTNESRDLGARLRNVVDGGVAMLLVDHDMGLVLSVCDEVVVLDFGQVIARGTPQEVRRDHRVIEAYLGSAAAEIESSLDAADRERP